MNFKMPSEFNKIGVVRRKWNICEILNLCPGGVTFNIEAEKTGDSALSEKVKWAYLLSDLPVF